MLSSFKTLSKHKSAAMLEVPRDTQYTAEMNYWGAYRSARALGTGCTEAGNKADICAVQCSNETFVFKTWPTFQELTSIVSFRRRWSPRNFSENRNIQGNLSKDVLNKIRGLRRNIFLASRRWRCRTRLLQVPTTTTVGKEGRGGI